MLMIKQKVEIKDDIDVTISFRLTESHIDLLIKLYDNIEDLNVSLYINNKQSFYKTMNEKTQWLFINLLNLNLITLEDNSENIKDKDIFATYPGIIIYNHFKNLKYNSKSLQTNN